MIVRPRAIDSIPKVTMNDGTLKIENTTPLNVPAARPTARAATTPGIGPYAAAMTAATTPVSATTEPIERSMLPAMITRVTPNAGIAMIALC